MEVLVQNLAFSVVNCRFKL